ncbi:hypothetical protein IWW55_002245 [Coemansia sp. RSA 2706]|nr:hypothetical protein IWW55_002245 [Coemansia sp. RSA 2706]
MSSLAMTAIKSSRQRRALVNSTLLTQHTLPAEAALQQHAMKLALRGDRRGMRRSESASVLGLHGPPPAPPPTPLSARALLHQARTASAMNSPTTISPKRSGIVTDVGTPYESQSQASDSSETATAAANGRQTNSIAPEDADGNGSDTGYAFGWVEDEEDLALFAMPSIDESEDQQPSLTMLLAANSPMLMPYRSESDVGSERPL